MFWRTGGWTRDVLGGIVHVERLVYRAWNGLYLGAQFLLDFVEIESVIPIDEVDGKTKMAKTARTTDPVQISLSILGEVKIDDNVHRLDVDSAGEKI